MKLKTSNEYILVEPYEPTGNFYEKESSSNILYGVVIYGNDTIKDGEKILFYKEGQGKDTFFFNDRILILTKQENIIAFIMEDKCK